MKSYYRVNWTFLFAVLSAFGFSDKCVTLFKGIVSCCQFSILVNSETCGFITAKQGLRQGDPLSPAIFILMNEWFSRGINDLIQKNPSMFYHIPKGLCISHLAYVDDCILICNGKKTNLEMLKMCLLKYESVSGQKINVIKSGFIAEKLANSGQIASCLGFYSMLFPFNYLGAPICKGKK